MALRFVTISAALILVSSAVTAAPQPIMKPSMPSVVPIPIASPLREAEPVDADQPTFAASVAAVVAGQPAAMTEASDAGASKPVKIYWFLSGR